MNANDTKEIIPSDSCCTVEELKNLVSAFINERNWQSFHGAKNLSMSVAIEAAELMELFQWLTPDECQKALSDSKMKAAVSDELSDVLSYLLSLAIVAEIDISAALKNKMIKNRLKYPAASNEKLNPVVPPEASFSVGQRSIRDFQKLMNDLYGSRDRNRGVDRTYMWLVEEIGELSRSIRKKYAEQYPETTQAPDRTVHNVIDENIREELADILAWLCSISNVLEIDLEAAALKKYPDMCARCSSSPCRCPIR